MRYGVPTLNEMQTDGGTDRPTDTFGIANKNNNKIQRQQKLYILTTYDSGDLHEFTRSNDNDDDDAMTGHSNKM